MKKVPADLHLVLAKNPQAKARWDSLTQIGRRDFISWIESAKQKETRTRRVESVPSRLASGKRRPCCYALVPMSFYRALSVSPKARAAWKRLTPEMKRDFVAWIDAEKDTDKHARRVAKACGLLAAGKPVWFVSGKNG